DFPKEHLDLLASRKINTEGIQHVPGKTFSWSGRYGYDLHEAHTLATHLNVLEKFDPVIPESYRNSEFVFLGNLAPKNQQKVLSSVTNPKFVALDTMNFWIEGCKDDLIATIKKCHALVINEGELRQLTNAYNLVQAAKVVRQWGPQTLVVKRGE